MALVQISSRSQRSSRLEPRAETRAEPKTQAKAEPTQRPAAGCIMCDSLYVKPDGAMPCWDDVGEDLILRRLDEEKLIAGEETGIFTSPPLVKLRQDFQEGRMPHPDFCSRCPLYGHGLAQTTEPKVMNVLHVEPVYLCQLACPQCFTPKERLKLKEPPYYMSLDFYQGLLDQLRREGVEHIRLVHFEGRGEPLLHQKLGEMVAATKATFPDAFVMATSHGNFPYRSWMHTSGLDVLRLSVDGAFEESYRRYRVGGTLQKPLDLMDQIQAERRNHPESPLRLEWKYILFEWNDSDRELKRAGELADQRGVRLRFCLTHTPGRSLRFQDPAALEQDIEQLVPGAGVETTFQLRSEPSEADSSHVLAEHAEALLVAALGSYRRSDPERAERLLAEALKADPGNSIRLDELWSGGLEPLLSSCRFPGTAVALANIAQYLQEWHAAEALYRRYLDMAPDAADREKVETTALELAIGNRLGRHVDEAAEASPQDRRRAARAAAELDSGLPRIARRWPGSLTFLRRQVASAARPHTLLQLARLWEADGDLRTALYWLEAALDHGEPLCARNAGWRESLRLRMAPGGC